MKITDTISVNPSKTTLGHVDESSSIFRSTVLSEEREQSVDVVKVLFPGYKAGVYEYNKYAVPMRTLFATILIVTGISLLEASVATGLAICSLCFGAFLAIGFMTRPVMLGAAIFYCINGALALRGGNIDMTSFTLMFGALIFAIVGSGKYSCDSILRSCILKHRKIQERKNIENYMGYKAFHKVKI